MKSYTYTEVDCSGKIRTFRCPSIFSPDEVRDRLTHSLVFLHVPKGHSIYAETLGMGTGEDRIEGPNVIYKRTDGRNIAVGHAPANETEAYHFHQMTK